MPTRILGISAYHHDSAACVVEDRRIVAAAQEERFSRKKHDAADVHPARRVGDTAAADDLWGIEKLNVPRSTIPAVTHVDYSARIQTVRRETNPFYYDIIEAFRQMTGCPIVVNTSFNVRGEPIVCTPEDAYRCFMRTNIDALVLEDFLLLKPEQAGAASAADESWRTEFVLD